MTARTEQIEAEIDATRRRVSEDIDAIRDRLSPGQLLDQAMAYMKTGPAEYAGDVASNLGRSVRDNPLPVLLLGVGAAWLMMSSSEPGPRRRIRYDDGPYDDDSYRAYDDEEDDAATETVSMRDEDLGVDQMGPYQTTEAYPYAPGEPAAAGGTTTSGEAGSASRLAEDARQRARDFGHAARETGEAGRERAERAAGGARSAGRRAAGRLRGGMQSAGRGADAASRRAGRNARHAGEQAVGFFEEQPIALAALGIAAGALLGGIIPQTRTEHRTLGPARDRLRDEAIAKGQEGLDQADRMVSAGLEAGQREAEAHGLTPADAAQRLKEAEDSAVQVAKAAGKGAEAERERQKQERSHS